MQTTTALILRDPKKPHIRTLETDGPNPRYDPIVNYAPRTNLGCFSFEEFTALPDHEKKLPDSPGALDYAASIRIHNLLKNTEETGYLSTRHLRELIWRMKILYPNYAD